MAETRKTLQNISFSEFSHIRKVYLGAMAERQGESLNTFFTELEALARSIAGLPSRHTSIDDKKN